MLSVCIFLLTFYQLSLETMVKCQDIYECKKLVYRESKQQFLSMYYSYISGFSKFLTDSIQFADKKMFLCDLSSFVILLW